MPEIPKPSPTISSPDPGRANLDAVLPIVYEELRSLAASYMSREGHAACLRPTALVHEAWRPSTTRVPSVTSMITAGSVLGK